MDIQASAAAVRTLISEGNTEEAIEQLISLLESNKAYAELLRTVRVNQADWFQLKSQSIRSVISNEDARLTANQINDNILEVVDLVEAGKFTFDSPNQGDAEFKSNSKQAWRYYLSGGIITLAISLLGWNYLGRGTASNFSDCPKYEGSRDWKILILPFRQTGDAKAGDQALEIAEGLNSLIERTAQLSQAVAIVNEKYDISNKYPTPDEAAKIAENCGAQMIVWGRINQEGVGKNYKLDVRYRLLEGSQTSSSGDTTLINLLKMSDEGQLIRDLDAVTKRLYKIIADRLDVPADARAYRPLPVAVLMEASAYTALQRDSIVTKLHESIVEGDTSAYAEKVYTQILSLKENDSLALVRRGTLRALDKRYNDAIADWEKVAFNPKSADPKMLKVRVEAYKVTGDYDRASKDLKAYTEKQPSDTSFVRKANADIEKGRSEKIAELNRKSVKTKGQSTNKIVAEAEALLKTGMHEEAKKKIEKIPAKDANKPEVIGVKVDMAQRAGGDDEALKVVEKAKKSGVTPKQIEVFYPQVELLEPKKQ